MNEAFPSDPADGAVRTAADEFWVQAIGSRFRLHPMKGKETGNDRA